MGYPHDYGNLHTYASVGRSPRYYQSDFGKARGYYMKLSTIMCMWCYVYMYICIYIYDIIHLYTQYYTHASIVIVSIIYSHVDVHQRSCHIIPIYSGEDETNVCISVYRSKLLFHLIQSTLIYLQSNLYLIHVIYKIYLIDLINLIV